MQSTVHSVQTLEPATRIGILDRSGLLFVFGAMGFVVHLIWRSVLTAGVDPVASARDAFWVPANVLGIVSAALVLLGWPVLRDRVAASGSRSAPIGVILLEMAWWFFGLFLSLYGALVLPWLADEAPRLVGSASTSVVVAFGIGFSAWLLGAGLLSIPYLRGTAHPRWVGYLLPASALWALVGSFLLAPDGPASHLGLNLLSNLGPALLLIALGTLALRSGSKPGGDR